MKANHVAQLLAGLKPLFTALLGFLWGKSLAEKRQLKQQTKQLKQWQRNQYKSFVDVSNTLKKGKFIILFCLLVLGGCTGTINLCPPLVEYTLEEQQELHTKLERYQDKLLNRYILDYGNLRSQLRRCQ